MSARVSVVVPDACDAWTLVGILRRVLSADQRAVEFAAFRGGLTVEVTDDGVPEVLVSGDEVPDRPTVHDLPMGGCSTSAAHYAHLEAGSTVCENQREV